ncbi:MAG: D-hexose-6-phosphate mutarotase [Cyanobacteria bacterium SZAS-4]|nr:D-hexose-6-phosphate mutarotase [Cyanobacteria bacterium SZAS-4]
MNKQTLPSLIDHFGIDEVLVFSENDHGAIKATVNTPTCSAEVYMQGAHLTRWQPANQNPVLFLSERSAFEQGKAIRGGVPLIFPWFGAHKSASDSSVEFPSHGFARTSNDWLLVGAGRSKDDFMMTFELTESEQSRTFGYDNFKVTYKIAVGEELELELIVENHSSEAMQIEEAFHTYFAVSNVEKISLIGLVDTEYLDKTDNFNRKKQIEKVLQFSGETDRPYLNSESAVQIEDPDWKRKILVDKLNSQSTVIWNPWKEQTAKLSDMEPNGWQQMVCVETANLGENAITIPAGKHHAMHARIRLT